MNAASSIALSAAALSSLESGLAFTLNKLGDLLYEQGNAAGARKVQEESLAIRTELGEKGNVAQSELDLACLNIEADLPMPRGLLGKRSVGIGLNMLRTQRRERGPGAISTCARPAKQSNRGILKYVQLLPPRHQHRLSVHSVQQ
jgi:hypothetical protein